MTESIIAGIITFNPDIERLQENVAAIKPQVDQVVIVDNGSENLDNIRELIVSYEGMNLINNSYNTGMAAALNQLFSFAKKNGFEYVLTLDQDSVVFPDIIEQYSKYLGIEGAASFTSLREDRNFQIKNDLKLEGEAAYSEVDQCITSGNLVAVQAWEDIGGFDERLFIDRVDHEFCFRLHMNGYKIIQINKTELLHELGNAFTVMFAGRQRVILNHSAFRKYYFFRNTVYLLRKYPEARKYYSYKRLFFLFCVALIYEDDKWNKAKSSLKGFFDGFRLKKTE